MTSSSFTIKRLNHMVLYVRDAQRAAGFYREVLGFEVAESMGDRAVFLRANGSDNHHDLGLFSIGADAPPPTQGERVGLYHGAWEVAELPDLARARAALLASGALVGENDHGSSLSLYAHDPDGNEFEVFWLIPNYLRSEALPGPEHVCAADGQRFPAHAEWRAHLAEVHGLPMVKESCNGPNRTWPCSGLERSETATAVSAIA